MSRLAFVVLLLASVGCTQPRSAECSKVCAREAECHDQKDTHENFDEGECLDACAALERDVQAKEQVQHHVDCVEKAGASCEQVLACQP